jgi:hypothetical protein
MDSEEYANWQLDVTSPHVVVVPVEQLPRAEFKVVPGVAQLSPEFEASGWRDLPI